MSLFLSLPNVGFAFSSYGHQLICQVAFELSDKSTQQFIENVLKQGEPIKVVNFAPYIQQASFGEFAKGCTWPDIVRNTSHRYTNQYHFMNVPKDAEFDHKRDCADNKCITQAIQPYALQLSNKKLNHKQRKEALFFLGHFVADIHQPLHVGYTEDKGGNTIKVFANPSDTKLTSLHWIWDKAIPEYAGLYNAAAETEMLIKLRQMKHSASQNVDPKVWAVESFNAAQLFVYLTVDDKEIKSKQRLSQAYYERAKPLMRNRFQQAALRLAIILELIANEELTPDMFQ
jgi:hypothetical protein